MSSEPAITLYDIPSTRSVSAWSPNTWKVRLVLNYKQLPYKTVWVNYPDIKPTMISIGAKPTGTSPDGDPLYTLPTIVDTSSGSPVVVTDSLAIAEYLDTTYPEHLVLPMHGRALQSAFEKVVRQILGPHLGQILLLDTWKMLEKRCQPYFRETREKWSLGGKMTLEELSPPGPVREAHWVAFEKAWDSLAEILDQNGPGVDYVAGGEQPTRADMVLVSYLAWIAAVLPEDWENRVRHWSAGRWERLWMLSEGWRAVL